MEANLSLYCVNMSFGMICYASAQLLFFVGKKIGENISENDFVKVLTKKVQGTMSLTASDRTDAYEAAGPLQKVKSSPTMFFFCCCFSVLNISSCCHLNLTRHDMSRIKRICV